MSLTALLPAAIPSLAVLSAGVARAAASGLSFAAMLADPAGETPSTSPVAAKPGLPAQIQKQLGQFAAMLKERLGAMGQSLKGTVELSADVLGGIQASGGEQDAQAVNQLLEQDQELSSAFLQLASAFQQAMGNPNGAGISLPWDASGAARGVNMIVGENGAELVAQ